MGKVGLARKNTLQVLQNSPDQLPRMGGSRCRNAVFLLPRPGELEGVGRAQHTCLVHASRDGCGGSGLAWLAVSSQGPYII